MAKLTNPKFLIPLLTILHLIQPITTLCGDNCLECSPTQSCLQCTSTTYIAIASIPTKGCLPCRPGCKSCSSQYSSCVSCAVGYYMNNTAGRCMGCLRSFCDSCDEQTPDFCTVCSSGYYLVESTGACQACSLYPYAATCRESMILSCQLGYFVSGGQKCLPCGANCLKCTSSTFCSTCKDGFFGSSCTACNASCQTCLRSTACLTCKPGLYLNGTLCTLCPISTNPSCLACDSSTNCTKCPANYYLNLSKICSQLQPSSKITNCNRYQMSSTTYTILCKQCQSGYYLSASGTACLPCSILCTSCSGMYSTSGCTSCSTNIATQISTGVCAYTINSLMNFYQNSYISEWNYPNNYTYLGSLISVQNENCPSWKFSTRTRVKIGMIKGYNISYKMKVTFSVNDNSLLLSSGWNLSINNYSLGSVSLSASNITLTQCSANNLNRSTTQYTTIIQGTLGTNFDVSILSPANPLTTDSNYFQLQSLSTNLYLTVNQLVITYHICHTTCLLCQSDTQCILCKDRSLLLQKDQCVSLCGELYYRLGQTCVKTCPAGTYGNPYAQVWSCTQCSTQCSRCTSASSCITCAVGYFLFDSKCLTACPSQYFANPLTSRCQPCSPPCFTCNSSKTCLSCSYNILYNSTCISPTDCPDGHYPSLESMSCVTCPAPCLTCQSETLCKSCLPNQGYLYKNRCIQDCPAGYLKNSTTSLCDQCSPLCRTCFNKTDYCLQCVTGFLLDGHCLASCPNGFFENYTTMECTLCQSPCSTCRTDPYTCTLCVTGYIFHEQFNRCFLQNQCLNLAGSYLTSYTILVPKTTNSSTFVNKTIKSCIKCPEQCSTCTSATNCQSCQQNYYLLNSRCLINCPYGYFNNKRSQQCNICSSNCQTCTEQATYCTSCPLNTRLSYRKTCDSGCQNRNQIQPTCQKCTHPCFTCINQTTQCQSCVTGYYLNNQTRQCLSRCYDGYFADRMSKMCLKCNASCLTCTNSSTQCTTCPGTNYLFILDSYFQAGYCVAQCPSRYYPQILSIALQRCFLCQEPCLQCIESSTKCLSCVAGVLNANQCLIECPSDKYLDISNNSCILCSSKCLTCFGPSSSECYNCRSGYYYLDSQTKCIQNCTLGYISSNISSRCEPCEFPCLQCSNTTTACTKCWRNPNTTTILYYLYEKQCLRRCPSGTYAVNDSCLYCQAPCKECVSATLCLTCLAGKYFLLNQCLNTCPQGYFHDGLTMSCIKCLYPCKSCTSQTQCLTCIDGVRVGTTCSMIDQCPSGQFLEYSQTNGICKQCSPECSECVNHANRCIKCTNSSLFLFNHQCLSSCLTGYYPIKQLTLNTYIGTCTLCPTECNDCLNQTYCTKCAEGLYYIEGKCVEKCPPTHYRITKDLVDLCVVCSDQCKTCVNSQSNCLSCHVGFFWYQFKCLELCPVGTYPEYNGPVVAPLVGAEDNFTIPNQTIYNGTDPIIVPSPMPKVSGICRQCLFPCKECINSKLCVYCLTGFYLYQGICIQNCKKPHVIYQQTNGTVCIDECPSTHKFRLDIGQANKCSSTCQYPYVLSSNKQQCLTSCPFTEFANQNLQCQAKTQNLNDILSQISVESFVDSEYRIKLMIYFSQAVDYSQISLDLKNMMILKGYNDALYNQSVKRLLTSNQFNQQSYSVQYRIIKLTENYFTLQMNPASLNSMSSKFKYLAVQFKQNSNLRLRNKITSLPIQSSSYTCLLPTYQVYPNSDNNFSNFAVFGSVLTVFLLLISLILLAFNWYAKIYESLHFYQLVFLLSVLQIQYPPNLWIFLQGFKNSHFYFIKNWFISQSQLNKITESLPKISAIFIDSNFIRIFGHIFCFLLIILVISFILFLSKYLRNIQKIQNETYKLICKKMYSKYKLIKWSHIHDFFTSITMILVFSFTVQMYDYGSSSVLQTFGILLSYIFVIVVGVYYGYMGYKLHKIVKLSQQDPRGFCDKKYLFRSNMLSITQSAIHPKQLYLNYLRTSRIILFGSLIGLFSISPMLCTGCLITVLFVSALVYLFVQPYPDNLQNRLLGLADVCSMCGLLFISGINFVTLNMEEQVVGDYFKTKWVLGWFAIIFLLVGAFLLLAQLLVSIVKGNSSPLRLPAEDPKYLPPLLIGAPKNIEVSPKKELVGWEINGDDKSNTFGFRYEEKTS